MFKFLLKIFNDFFNNFFSISILPTAVYVVYNFNSHSWKNFQQVNCPPLLSNSLCNVFIFTVISFLILKTQKFPTYVLPFNTNCSWVYLPAIIKLPWAHHLPPIDEKKKTIKVVNKVRWFAIDTSIVRIMKRTIGADKKSGHVFAVNFWVNFYKYSK